LGTLEFELRAAVDPRADAVAVIPFARNVDDPLFFNKAGANGDVNSGVRSKKRIFLLHDFGVPNLTAKVGRFHLRFGRWNLLHNHDWPTRGQQLRHAIISRQRSHHDNGLKPSATLSRPI